MKGSEKSKDVKWNKYAGESKGNDNAKAYLGKFENIGESVDDWFIDSGATDYMCRVRSWFKEYEELEVSKSIKI